MNNRVRTQAELYLAPFVSQVEADGWNLETLSPLVLCAVTLHRTGGVKKLEQQAQELTAQIAEAEKSSAVPGITEAMKQRLQEVMSLFPATKTAEERLAKADWLLDPETLTLSRLNYTEDAKTGKRRGSAKKTLSVFCIEHLYDCFASVRREGTEAKFREEILKRLKPYFPDIDGKQVLNAIDNRKRRQRQSEQESEVSTSMGTDSPGSSS